MLLPLEHQKREVQLVALSEEEKELVRRARARKNKRDPQLAFSDELEGSVVERDDKKKLLTG